MVKPVIAIGAGAGLGVGFLILVLVLFFQRRQRLSQRYVDRALYDPPTTPGALSTRQTSLPSTALSSLRNNLLGSRSRLPTVNIEPFIMPGQEEPPCREPVSSLPGAAGRTLSSDNSSFGTQNQIYVVHHDSQDPPVTIYHEDGTRIVELPPRYPVSGSGRSERTNGAWARGGSRRDGRSDGEPADTTVTPRIIRERQWPTAPKSLLGRGVD